MADNVNMEQILHKRMLSKFDKLLNRFTAEYLKLYRSECPEDLSKALNSLNEDIDQLQYDAFKYGAALSSIERDDVNNESELEEINHNIAATQAEIKNMQEELQRQEMMKVNKEEFNCIAREVKNFDTRTEMDKKIQQVENEICMIEEQHKADMDNIARQESYLRTALSAMACLVDCNKRSNK